MIKEKISQSFYYALKGLKTAWKEERNFKIEIIIGFLAFVLGIVLNMPLWQITIIILTIGVVLTTEALNTALEALCDKFQSRKDPHIAKIKDLAAGAVLIVSVCAVMIGIFMFVPHLLPIIVHLDAQISNWIFTIQNHFWLTIFSWLTILGSIYTTVIIGAIAIIILLLKSKFRTVWGFVVTLIGSALTAQIIKHLINRPRPGIGPFSEELFLSFPSGHATIAMALFGFLIYLMLKDCRIKKQYLITWIIGIAIILLIGFSRLYIGAHFTSDILAGYLIGGIWLAFGIFVSKKKSI